MATLTTAEKIAQLEKIRDSGVEQTRFDTGAGVTYRSLAEIDQALTVLYAQRAAEQATAPLRRVPVVVTRALP